MADEETKGIVAEAIERIRKLVAKREKVLVAIRETQELQEQLPGEIEALRKNSRPGDDGAIRALQVKQTQQELCEPSLAKHNEQLQEVDEKILAECEQGRPILEAQMAADGVLLEAQLAGAIRRFCLTDIQATENVKCLPLVKDFHRKNGLIMGCAAEPMQRVERFRSVLMDIVNRGTILPRHLHAAVKSAAVEAEKPA